VISTYAPVKIKMPLPVLPPPPPAPLASCCGGGEPLVQGAAGAELQAEERQAAVLADLVNLHDVRVRQPDVFALFRSAGGWTPLWDVMRSRPVRAASSPEAEGDSSQSGVQPPALRKKTPGGNA
jgi:hypothetical protein